MRSLTVRQGNEPSPVSSRCRRCVPQLPALRLILQPDTINHKRRRLAPFSAGSILAQDKGPHRFGGTSRAQSPAVRSFYGTRKPNRFSGKPLNSAPLTNENNDFKRHFGYHEQIGCFLRQQSNCRGRLQIIERVFSRMYRQPRNMKGSTR